MKYIRTKDGKILERATFTINHTKYIGSIGNANLYQDNDIEKEADNIDELFDVIVYINGFRHELYRNFQETREDFSKFKIKFQQQIIYGAIWTDKGLIYVVKMNSKGEFELIREQTPSSRGGE